MRNEYYVLILLWFYYFDPILFCIQKCLRWPCKIIYNYIIFIRLNTLYCRSQQPRGLRRRSAAARLLGSWVRIPPGRHRCLSVVSVLCCQVEVSATSWSLVQRSPTDCGASLCCDLENPQEWGGHDPRWVATPHKETIYWRSLLVGLHETQL